MTDISNLQLLDTYEEAAIKEKVIFYIGNSIRI